MIEGFAPAQSLRKRACRKAVHCLSPGICSASFPYFLIYSASVRPSASALARRFSMIEQPGDQHEEERNDGHHQQQAGLLSAPDLADHGVDGCGLCGGVDFALIGLLLIGGNLIRVVQHAARDIGEGGDADDDG